MICLPLTLRHAIRLGAHPAPMHRVRTALEGIRGYDPARDAPRIHHGRLVVADHLADPVARALDAMGMIALADALHVEAEAARARVVQAG